MARQFTTPVVLPGNPAAALQAVPQQYCDLKALASRQVTAGTGLTGGGDLTADRTLTVAYGTSSTTACVGNDSRLSDVRAPTGAAAGSLTGTYPNPGIALVPWAAYTKTWASTISIDPTLGNNVNITATAATSLSVSATGAVDGQMILVSILASGGTWSITLTSTTFTTGLASPVSVASGKVGFLGFRYCGLLSAWVLLSQTNSL